MFVRRRGDGKDREDLQPHVNPPLVEAALGGNVRVGHAAWNQPSAGDRRRQAPQVSAVRATRSATSPPWTSNHAQRLRTLRGLTPCEFVCRTQAKEPDRLGLEPVTRHPGPAHPVPVAPAAAELRGEGGRDGFCPGLRRPSSSPLCRTGNLPGEDHPPAGHAPGSASNPQGRGRVESRARVDRRSGSWSSTASRSGR